MRSLILALGFVSTRPVVVFSLALHEATDAAAVATSKIGGPPQDLPKFQTSCLTPKSVQTCWNYSPDGEWKVWFKKRLTPSCPMGVPYSCIPRSHYWLELESWPTHDWLFTDIWFIFYAPKHTNNHPVGWHKYKKHYLMSFNTLCVACLQCTVLRHICMQLEVDFRGFRVDLEPEWVVMSLLRLAESSDCTSHPYDIYTQSFLTLLHGVVHANVEH